MIAKLTRVYGNTEYGRESAAEDVELIDGRFLRFPPSDGNDAWKIYLPMKGFDVSGPWYWWKEVLECFADLTPNRLMLVEYSDVELVPQLVPGSDDYSNRSDEFWGKGFDDSVDWQDRLNRVSNLTQEHLQRSSIESTERYNLAPLDNEWPSVVYENPADWFDDNQVIDA